MGQFLSLFLFFLSVSFLSPFGLFSDEIITTKEDEPDAYYGLKLNSVITPTFGYRLRDSSSGVSNSMPNDRTGFSLP
ncbi:MAG: hypothetical protein KDK36_15390, partial [Leptospiraceae bacterium]|nr:hypothetical protein [Leptospiraceae bacterium]